MKIENLPLQIKENIMSTYDSILEKGIEIGTAKGMEKGIETKAIQVVLSAFAKDVPIDLIANITNLAVEQVLQILEDNQRL